MLLSKTVRLNILEWQIEIRQIIQELKPLLPGEIFFSVDKYLLDNSPKSEDDIKKILSDELIRIGFLLLKAKHIKEARQLLGFIIRFYPMSMPNRLMLHLLYEQKNYHLIPHLFKNEEMQYALKDDDDYYRVGDAYYQCHYYEKAMEYFERVSFTALGDKDINYKKAFSYYKIAEKSSDSKSKIHLKLAHAAISQHLRSLKDSRLEIAIEVLQLKKKIEDAQGILALP